MTTYDDDGSFYLWEPLPKKCECGGTKSGVGTHSSWCQLAGTVDEGRTPTPAKYWPDWD